MAKILLILGGTYHDFDGFAATMTPVLSQSGHEVETTSDFTALERLDTLRPDVIMLDTCLGNSSDGKRSGKDFTPAQTAALTTWVERGHGLVGIHSATVSEKSNTAYHRLIGGHFATHPPQCDFTVTPRLAAHPITAGINAFTVHDELYMHDLITDGEILAATLHDGKLHPMLWTRRQGAGSIAYFAPGHDAKAWNIPEFRTIVTRCVDWTLASKQGR